MKEKKRKENDLKDSSISLKILHTRSSKAVTHKAFPTNASYINGVLRVQGAIQM